MTCAPGPSGWNLLRTLLALRRAPLSALVESRTRWGDFVRFPLGGRTFYLLSHPTGAEHVLRTHAKNYTKGTWTYGLLRSILGNGLLTSDGAEWRRQRTLVQPAFHKALLETLATTVVDAADEMLERWLEQAKRNVPVDAGAEMTRLALAAVSRAILGVGTVGHADAVGRHLNAVLDHLQRKVASVVDWPASWPLAQNRRFRRNVLALQAVVQDIVEARRRSPGTGADLVAILLEAGHLTDREIRDQVMTFLLAGHETTANLLTWTLAMVTEHADVERALRREVDGVLGGARPTAEHITRLPYGRMVLQETARLYPPIWTLERRAEQADEVGGFALPAGASVAICLYVLHRHPSVWRDPERFDPDRFAAGAVKKLPPCAYVPFGAGFRTCVGEAFATMEAQLVLARMLQAVRFERADEGPSVPAAYVTLRPERPLRLRVR
jgi:cytochrome P450